MAHRSEVRCLTHNDPVTTAEQAEDDMTGRGLENMPYK